MYLYYGLYRVHGAFTYSGWADRGIQNQIMCVLRIRGGNIFI